MSEQETLLTKVTPASLIKSIQFFLGLAMGIATLWYSSTQWQKNATEMLFEIRELRKTYVKMESDIIELTQLAREHEKNDIKYSIRLDMLEAKVRALHNLPPFSSNILKK